MFEHLSEKLEEALKQATGQGRINELNIAQTMREIRRALLDADVNYQVAREFTERVKEKALGTKVLTSVSPGQQLVKIVYDELVHLLGDTQVDINRAQNIAQQQWISWRPWLPLLKFRCMPCGMKRGK